MAVELIRSPGGLSIDEDPDLGTGLRLVAAQRKFRIIQTVKIGLVWIALVALIIFVLLQLNIDPKYAFQHLNFVLQGVLVTVGVSLASIIFATILALFGALGRLSHNYIAQGISGLYVSMIRGTPLLIQIYLIYNGLPQIGTQLQAYGLHTLGRMLTLSAIQSGVLALSLNYGAYMTEIFRAGIQSIAHGQREAAEFDRHDPLANDEQGHPAAGCAGDHPRHRQPVYCHAEGFCAGLAHGHLGNHLPG